MARLKPPKFAATRPHPPRDSDLPPRPPSACHAQPSANPHPCREDTRRSRAALHDTRTRTHWSLRPEQAESLRRNTLRLWTSFPTQPPPIAKPSPRAPPAAEPPSTVRTPP